jgi:hypothetical protein
MKALVLISLFGVGAVAIWKHHLHATANKNPVASDVAAAGVSVYPGQPAPSKPDQVLAALSTNPDAVSDLGYAAAFGQFENQPGDGEELY